MQSNVKTGASTSETHVQGVDATSGGLLKATLGAAAVAGAILTFVWLPAEHGIDPTGVGHLLGLTEMGRIKEQLHAEADADQAIAAQDDQPEFTNTVITDKLDAIQKQLTAISATIEATSQSSIAQESAQSFAEPVELASEELQTQDVAALATAWLDEAEYELMPGEGIEIKLVMKEGAIAEFEWSANGAVVNHDTHGDGDGQSISYEKGRSVPEQAGKLEAAFTGNHGWYWRNRTDDDVILTLRTRGDYSEMLLPY